MSGEAADRHRPGYVHASAVVIGEAGVLIRGAAGAGKSTLAEALIAHAAGRGLFARLVGDDRVAVKPAGGRVILSGHPAIAGRIERRGAGIAEVPVLEQAVLRLVVDLLPTPRARLPEPAERQTEIAGIVVPRLAIEARTALPVMLPLVMTALPQYLGNS